MTEYGKRMTCDVCGKQVFQEESGKPSYDRANDYSYMYPDIGWKKVEGLGELCPDCAEALTELYEIIKARRFVR